MTANPMDYGLLKANARANRKNMTEAESAFWSMSKGNLFGQRCIRQHIQNIIEVNSRPIHETCDSLMNSAKPSKK